MDTQKLQRLAELQEMNNRPRSNTARRSWQTSSNYCEMITLQTELHNEQAREANAAARAQAQSQPRPQNTNPATDKQRAYLIKLGVRLEPGMTVSRASELIDAAKSHDLGSVGGFYQDGSN